jgi:hypothetical protein
VFQHNVENGAYRFPSQPLNSQSLPRRPAWRDPVPAPPSAPQRFARVGSEATHVLHGLTAGVWYPVRDRNPEGRHPEPLPGYFWIEGHGHLLHVWEGYGGVRENPSALPEGR